MFDRILVPFEDSPTAQVALEQAILIAHRHGSTIHALHVIDPSVSTLALVGTDPFRGAYLDAEVQAEAEWHEQARAAAGDLMSGVAERCLKAQVRCVTLIETGSVVGTLVDRAHDCDLVVIAQTSRPSPSSLRLSPLLETLVWECPVNLWIVPDRPAMPVRVVLAFDGRAKACRALPMAAELARSWLIPLELLVVREAERINEATLERAEQALGELHLRQFSSHLIEGQPADAILQHSAPDALVVMGASAHARFFGLHFRHTVDAAVRLATGPLLVCA